MSRWAAAPALAARQVPAVAALLALAVLPLPQPGGARASVSVGHVRQVEQGSVPAGLQAVESGAEDVVDAALAGDRAGVVARAAALRAAALGPAAAALRRAHVPPATAARLERRAARLARLSRRAPLVEVLLAANQVSALMADLYARFHDRVPPQLLTLDYLDREAQFRSLARQPARVAAAIASLRRAWAALRPRVVTAGGGPEAAAFDRHVAAMRKLDPRAAAGVQAEARRGLELVDALERVFA